jgi:hypothetical protein
MDIVTKYLHIAIDQPGAKVFHIPMMLKLERLRDKLKICESHLTIELFYTLAYLSFHQQHNREQTCY